jgi:hypothetical protein
MLTLVIQQSPNQNPAYGSEDGVNLTVVETTVPIPAAVWLLGSAVGLLGFRRRKPTTV